MEKVLPASVGVQHFFLPPKLRIMPNESLTQTSRDGVTIVELGPQYENLEENLLKEIQAYLLEAAETVTPPCLVLDLSHTRFFGSSFIEVLFRVWNRIKKRGGRFALCALQDYCQEVIEITNLDRIWGIYPDQESAVAGVKDLNAGQSTEE